MNEISTALQDVADLASRLGAMAVDHLPRLVGALLFLLAGWFLARLAGHWVRRLLRGTNVLLRRHWRSRLGARLQLSTTVVGLSGTVARWMLFFFVLAGTAEIVGIDSLSDWAAEAVQQVPAVIAGLLLVFVGFVVSQFAREVVVTAFRPVAGRQAEVFGRLAQTVVVGAALVVGLGQAGVDTTLLVSIITIVLASLCGGMALAFGLGARDLVANVIGAHHARRSIPVGQVAQMGRLKGAVVRVTPTAVVLETAHGRAVVPGGLFQREAVVMLEQPEPADE